MKLKEKPFIKHQAFLFLPKLLYQRLYTKVVMPNFKEMVLTKKDVNITITLVLCWAVPNPSFCKKAL